MTNIKNLLILLFSLFLLCSLTSAQEISEKSANYSNTSKITQDRIMAALGYTMDAGDVLYTIQTGQPNIVGVTVVNGNIIVSTGGLSSESSDDNYFFMYSFDGTLINSYLQGSTNGYGFRDLAFDGTHILASDDNTIKKINPVTFQIEGTITNEENSVHRGLAYDSVDDVIWSTNGSVGDIVCMNASNGQTVQQFDSPSSFYKPYGIALDRYTDPDVPYLWFNEPWSYGTFRLSMMNTSDGLIYYSMDLTNAIGNPDSCLSGGLEIINDHPNYSDKVIAIAVEQNSRSLIFVDLTGFDIPDEVTLQEGSKMGGWINGGVINGNNAFVFQGNNLNVLNLAADKAKLSSVSFDAEPARGTKHGDFLYVYYPNWEDDYNNIVEYVNVSNVDNISKAGSFQTSRILERGIEKLAASGNRFFILTQESVNFGIEEKVLMYDVSSPQSLVFLNQLSADIKDIAVSGDYLYVLLYTGTLKIFDVSSDDFAEKGNIILTGAGKIETDGSYVYAACTSNNGLRIVDVSNPDFPAEAAVFGASIYNFYDEMMLQNSTVFLKTTDFNLVTVDVSDPVAPAAGASFDPGEAGNFDFAGVYSNSVYIASGGKLYDIDLSAPSTPVVNDGTNEPAMIRGNTTIGNYLYTVGDDKLWVYLVGENGEYEFDRSIHIDDANKVFNDGTYLFVCDRENLVFIYDTDLSLQGTFDAGGPVIDMGFGNDLMCLVIFNSTTVKLVNYSNPSAPGLASSFDLPYAGKAADISSDGSTLCTASNRTLIGGSIQGYFQVIDISDPSNPDQKSDKSITGGNQIYNLHIEGNTLFTGGSDNHGWFPVEAWDVSNMEDPTRLGRTLYQFPGQISDMAYYNGYVLATVPDEGEIATCRWDANANEFFPGPSISSSEPVEIVILNRETGVLPARSTSNIMTGTSTYDYAVVNNGMSWQQQTEGSKGNNLVKIVAVQKQDNPVLANLMMSINPAEAGQHGCTTSPAPGGPYTYIKNSTIAISATDNPGDGWCFKEWTGASGGSSTSLLMDIDKSVVANFAEVILTVTGSELEEAVCPETATEEDTKILPVMLCASEASGWSVQGITFKSSGTGDDRDCLLKVLNGSTVVGSSSFAADDGEAQVTFSNPVIVPANDCVSLTVYYDFTYDDPDYAKDTTYTFLLETSNVNATPQEFPGGLIEGSASRKGPLTIARIYNDWGVGFSSIQKAVNSDYTQDNGTCYLCEGTYSEEVVLDQNSKEVTVTSVNDPAKTIIKVPQDVGIAFKIADINNIKINKLSFRGPGSYGVNIYRSSSCIISNNTFESMDKSIVLHEEANYNTIENNTFNITKVPFTLYKAESNSILNNTFDNSVFEEESAESDIVISYGRDNRIYENNVLQPNGTISIELYNTKENYIYNNDVSRPAGYSRYSKIKLIESEQNSIYNNTLYMVELKKSGSNKIQNNELISVKALNESPDNDITDNNISNKDRVKGSGILINASYKNNILRNNISNNSEWGIYLHWAKDMLIVDNVINNNQKDGLSMSTVHDISVYRNTIKNNNYNGVDISDCSGINMFENKISGHKNELPSYGDMKFNAAGISFHETRSSTVFRNTLKENCTAINLLNCPDEAINIGQNDVSNSLCWFTGIHVENSRANIFGNNILNNEGNGIYFTKNSSGTVSSNNISGNDAYGVNNDDPDVVIDASSNFWGSQDGPSQEDMTGNMDVLNWLSEAVSLMGQVSADTIHAARGQTDSSIVHFQNLQNPDDVIDITITDQLGWLTGSNSFSSAMTDSLGTSANVSYTIPEDVEEGAVNTVTVDARSQTNEGTTVTCSFSIFVYEPLLHEMTISPDSSTVMVNDTLDFSVEASDQFGNEISINPAWSASGGEIDDSGLFTSSSAGQFEVTALDSISGRQAVTIVMVTESETNLATIKVTPDSVSLYPGDLQQFKAYGYNELGFPHDADIVWSCDHGAIDMDGYYTADSSAITCTITAEDTSSGIKGYAKVTINTIVSAKEVEIPADYKLFQNYPNPFNPSTTIRYALPVESKVNIEVLNILGERVTELVKDVQSAGYYELRFDASAISSGIYFYVISASPVSGGKSFRSVNKMMLIK